MVKETGKFDQERRVWSTRFAHFWLGASWHWQVGINRQQVSATAIYGHRGSPEQGSACFAQGMSFIHTGTPVEFVKYSRKRVR